MACDICGKTGTELIDLLDVYRTSEIKQICPSCVKEVEKCLFKIKALSAKMTSSLFSRFMMALKGKK